MNKALDKRFKNYLEKAKDHEDSKCDDYRCKHGYNLRLSVNTSILKRFYKEELDKQRTQLLARVREEVIGEETHQYCDNFNHDRSCQKEIGSDLLKREQLKKLEIISEEVKNEGVN